MASNICGLKSRSGDHQRDVSDLFASLFSSNNYPRNTIAENISKTTEYSMPEIVRPKEGLTSTSSISSVIDLATGSKMKSTKELSLTEPDREESDAPCPKYGGIPETGSDDCFGPSLQETNDPVVDLDSQKSSLGSIPDFVKLNNVPVSEIGSLTQTTVPLENTDSDSQKSSLGPIPNFGKLVSSPSSINSSSSDNGTQQDLFDGPPQSLVNMRPTKDVGNSASTEGFLFVQLQHLEKYLASIINQPWDFGFYVWDKMSPVAVEGVMRYRVGKEFTAKRIHGPETSDYGVFRCCDNQTKKRFIMKKIKKENKRLIGIEFLTQHSQTFLPKIYGVYKEENILCIYQEYIEGGTLHNCDWNLREIRHFAETLLSAFKYMHHHDLVHGDIKLLNLMVRDPRDPSSLVVIDLESAKHPKATFYSGGHTVTYLPPWHENISQLSQYDPVLKEADLWGIACVLIFFLLPSARSDLQKQEKAGVWSKELENFQRNCQTCKQNSLICDMCKKQLLQHVCSN